MIVIRKYMEERRKEDRVAELKRQREEEERRKAIKERLLALEMKRREGYVSCKALSRANRFTVHFLQIHLPQRVRFVRSKP